MSKTGPRRGFILSLGALAGLLAAPSLARAEALAQARTAIDERLSLRLGRGRPHRPARPDSNDSITAKAEDQALNEDQVATVGALAAAIVPADATPSARDLGAHLYAAAGLALVPPGDFAAIQAGLDSVAALALQTFGVAIADLPPEALEAFAAGLQEQPAVAPLWSAVRTLTVLYYYGQPQGYADLGLPGPSIDRGGFPDPGSLACLGAVA